MKYLVPITGAAVAGFVAFQLWRYSRQGMVMIAPFKHSPLPYTLKQRHITSPFNAARENGAHQGIDLRTLASKPLSDLKAGEVIAPSSTGKPTVGVDVLSPVDGVVTQVGSDTVSGNYIVIRCENGMEVGLMHLLDNGTLVGKGDNVVAGELVAISGSTGRSGGPHLHLQLRSESGKLIDPAPFLGLPATPASRNNILQGEV